MRKDCFRNGCKECNEKHNILLHIKKQEAQQITKESVPTVTNCSYLSKFSQTLLSTVELYVFDNNNKLHKARALLDFASQSNLIKDAFCNTLKLNKHKTNKSICGINQKEAQISSCVNIKIKSKYSEYTANLSCLVMKELTENLPSSSFKKNDIYIPKDIELADENFNISKPIDLLIGVNTFWEVITSERITPKDKHPIFQNTLLG